MPTRAFSLICEPWSLATARLTSHDSQLMQLVPHMDHDADVVLIMAVLVAVVLAPLRERLQHLLQRVAGDHLPQLLLDDLLAQAHLAPPMAFSRLAFLATQSMNAGVLIRS